MLQQPLLQSERIPILFVGLGAIGALALAEALEAPSFRVVGAVDPARAGEVVDGIQVVDNVSLHTSEPPNVVLVAAGSSLVASLELYSALLERGYHVVSTCEELAFPWRQHPELAAKLDATARDAGRVLIGCGVNPGFVMDVLPVLLSTTVLDARKIRVVRHVNLRKRRPQLLEKMGVGKSPSQWARDAHGHQGLIESAELCAHGAGWTIQHSAFQRRPIVKENAVTGVKEIAEIVADGGREVRLELSFQLTGRDRDAISVLGTPWIDLEMKDGIAGDTATVARMLATARVVGALSPGLRLSIEAPSTVIRTSFGQP